MKVGDRPTRLEAVTLPGREGIFDLGLDGVRVATVRPSPGAPSGWLALPAFADLHLHPDRAYLEPPNRPASLEEAVRVTLELRRGVTVGDIRKRAGRLLERALAHGTLRARCHVDVDDVVEWRSLEAIVSLRGELAGRLDLEVVAFATTRADPAHRDGQWRLREALRRGADLLGGVVWMYPDPQASGRALLDLAAEAAAGLDLHVDETVDGKETWIDLLARGALERGLIGRLTVSHGCLLSELSAERAEAAIDALAEARATVVALPATNLYLQDRRTGTPRRRGLTLVRELADAGVAVRFGSDNVADSFYPYGDADPLEAAFLAALAAHIDDEKLLLAGITDGRSAVKEGDPADLVLVQAKSVSETLARRPALRTVLRGGEVVAAPSG